MIDRYTTPEMRDLWSLGRQYETWLDVELATCVAMERAGDVPEGTARVVREAVRLDPDRVDELEQISRHDVIAFLQHVEEQSGEPARHLHLGMTSSDVLDSSLALRMVQAADLIMEELERLATAAVALARRHRDTPMVGRSHGIHAEPTTAGMVFALTMMTMAVSDLTIIGQVGTTIGMGLIFDTLVILGRDRSLKRIRHCLDSRAQLQAEVSA